MEIFLFWFVGAFIAGVIAEKKGRSGGGILLLSLIVSPLIGIAVAFALQPNVERTEREQLKTGKMKKCPRCAEIIKVEALVCKHCGGSLVHHPVDDDKTTRALADKLAGQTKPRA